MTANNFEHNDIDLATLNRRRFFATGASGLGALAMGSLLSDDGLLAGDARKQITHFAPRAKRCIYLFMEGGPSQMDLFDPKPRLNSLDGQPMPDSILKEIKFAFIQKNTRLSK